MEDKGVIEPLTPLRHLKAVDLDAKSNLLPTYESSWAVVVGINNYIHFNRLDNALKDALGIAEVLVTRLDFHRENVFLALDPKPDSGTVPYALSSNIRSATKVDIEDLLLNVLPEKAGENDRVLVFYAGHGDQRPVPGEKNKSGAFLIPADALPGKWNTYVDWEMVRRNGDDFCKAKHIFYILDACYSGIVNTRDASEPPRDVRDSLTNRARQALAAGTNRQVVADAGREGHSPFTWHLIQGLRGDAALSERSAEGVVISAHDLIGYVRRRVAEENNTEQTPSGGAIPGHGGGDFVFTSPLIGFSSQEHMELGTGLMNLGLRTGERVCFESAARNLREAVKLKRLAREEAAEAEEWLGRSLLRMDNEDALPMLESAAAQGRGTALLYLGVAHARLGNVDAACLSLESFAGSLPNHADATWAAAYARQLRETGGKRNHALLVGIDRYPSNPVQGCVNDVLLVKALLEEVYGFHPANIRTLTDEEATAANIVTELENLAGIALPQDTVVFLFSGHGSQFPAMNNSLSRDGRWYALCPYDILNEYPAPSNIITEPQLHELLTQIPARDKLFLASGAHLCPDFDPSAVANGYRFFAGCERDQYEYEINVAGKYYGAFTYHLCSTLRKMTKKGTSSLVDELLREVKRALRAGGAMQVPAYFGNTAEPLLLREPERLQPNYLSLHDFSERREYAALDVSALEAWQSRLEALGKTTHPRAWLSCAHAWLSQAQPTRAADSARLAVEQVGCDKREACLLLCEAHLEAGNPDAALESSRALQGYAAPVQSAALVQTLMQLRSPHRRALLVAIQDYPKVIGVTPEGTLADAEALKSVLIDRCGFAEVDIELLTDAKASREAILRRFNDLARHAETEPALFYFSGLGMGDGSHTAVVTADAPHKEVPSAILLSEFSEWTGNEPTNLVAMIDAGWTRFDNSTTARMAAMRVYIPKGERVLGRSVGGEDIIYRNPSAPPQIGLATICTTSIERTYQRNPNPAEITRGSRGVLTMALVEAFQRPDALMMTYADWVDATVSARPHAQLKREGSRLFENSVLTERALTLVRQMSDQNLYETADLLRRLADLRKGRGPDSYLDLAIACMALDRIDDARTAVEIGLSYRQQQFAGSVMGTTNPLPEENEIFWAEAHYVRGRILFQLGHYSAAESALGIALRQLSLATKPMNVRAKLLGDAQLARAHYWHGRAVQELIRQDLLTAAEIDFKEYLRLGAPLGDSASAREFLTERVKAVEVKESEGGRKTKAVKRKRT